MKIKLFLVLLFFFAFFGVKEASAIAPYYYGCNGFECIYTDQGGLDPCSPSVQPGDVSACGHYECVDYNCTQSGGCSAECSLRANATVGQTSSCDPQLASACVENICVDYSCVARSKTVGGRACTSSGQCVHNICVDSSCVARPISEVGTACTSSGNCVHDICVNYTCTTLPISDNSGPVCDKNATNSGNPMGCSYNACVGYMCETVAGQHAGNDCTDAANIPTQESSDCFHNICVDKVCDRRPLLDTSGPECNINATEPGDPDGCKYYGCNGYYCSLLAGQQASTCTPVAGGEISSECAHYICVGQTCTQRPATDNSGPTCNIYTQGPGDINGCTHYGCNGFSCELLAGQGPNTCNELGNPSTQCSRDKCFNGTCVLRPITDAGKNCNDTSECTHRVCVNNNTCTTRPIEDTTWPACAVDGRCDRAVCNGKTCTFELGTVYQQGEIDCSIHSDSDCQHSECVGVECKIVVNTTPNQASSCLPATFQNVNGYPLYAECAHMSCKDKKCQPVAGPGFLGEDDCATDEECVDIRCIAGRCEEVTAYDPGNPVNQCSVANNPANGAPNLDCRAPVCQGLMCIIGDKGSGWSCAIDSGDLGRGYNTSCGHLDCSNKVCGPWVSADSGMLDKCTGNEECQDWVCSGQQCITTATSNPGNPVKQCDPANNSGGVNSSCYHYECNSANQCKGKSGPVPSGKTPCDPTSSTACKHTDCLNNACGWQWGPGVNACDLNNPDSCKQKCIGY